MSYLEDHAAAYADILEAGSSVQFTKESITTTETGSLTSWSYVTGAAIQIGGDFKEYAELSLIQRDPATLLFAPTTYGSLPELGSTAPWGGKLRTVYRVRPLSPDGVAILAKVVMA